MDFLYNSVKKNKPVILDRCFLQNHLDNIHKLKNMLLQSHINVHGRLNKSTHHNRQGDLVHLYYPKGSDDPVCAILTTPNQITFYEKRRTEEL